jgi:hypothetical protein
MVTNLERTVVRSAGYVFISVMIIVALYRVGLLVLGAMIWGIRLSSGFDVMDLLEGPLYLISAVVALRRSWIAELMAVTTLTVIFARFHPWAVSPFQRGLFTDYLFIASANVVFFANIWMRRTTSKRN